MKSFVKQHVFLMLLGFTSLVAVLIAFFYEIRFQGNDDVVMALISSGAYSGSLDNHLVYINFIYASILNCFYYLIPSIGWYALFFVLINIFSVGFIAKGIIKYKLHYVLKISLLVFLFSIFLQITADLQFTKTAGISAVSGLMLIIGENKKDKFLGVLFFLLGSFIRFDAAFLALLISIPIFLMDFLKFKKIGISNKNKMIFIAVSLALFFKVIDNSYYNSNNDWKYYKEYNNNTNKIYGNPNAIPLLNKNVKNLSSIDFESFLHFFPNPGVVDLDAVKNINQEIDKTPLKKRIQNIKQLEIYYRSLSFFIIIVLAYLLFTKGKFNKILISFVLLTLIGVLIYISLAASVKYRVFFICLIGFVFFLPVLFKNQPLKLGGSITVSIFIFLLTGYLNQRFYQLDKDRAVDAQNLNTTNLIVSEYLSDESKKITPFLLGYPIASQKAFHISHHFPTNKMYFTGWLSQIPFNKNRFDSFSYFTKGFGLLVIKRNAELATKFVQQSVKINTGVVLSHHQVLESGEFVIIEFNQE